MIKQMVLIIMLVLAPALVSNSVQAAEHVVSVHQYKEIHTLACEGAFMGYPAVVVGKREYVPYNNLGDGTVTFNGFLSIYSWQAQMMYEDYTNLVPYDGFLQDSNGMYSIDVLDNSGGKMIIYDGRPSLGAPDVWGEFLCTWK